jgi:CDP-diacylglycerol--glycerol-3-phosphate 3-phosphatidyltransferase
MDSVFDRWGEAVVYLGVVWGTVGAGSRQGDILATAAMGAAFMVSYARAKSEGLGFTAGKGMAEVGLMPREIRLVVLSAGLIATGLLGGVSRVDALGLSGATLLDGALALIAVLGTITVIQRIVVVRRQAAQQEHT